MDDTKTIMMVSWSRGKLASMNYEGRAVMKNLVGRRFSLADGHYRVVDVQRLGSDAMVYAERVDAGGAPDPEAGARRAPVRTAFHYGDIAGLLEAQQRA